MPVDGETSGNNNEIGQSQSAEIVCSTAGESASANGNGPTPGGYAAATNMLQPVPRNTSPGMFIEICTNVDSCPGEVFERNG